MKNLYFLLIAVFTLMSCEKSQKNTIEYNLESLYQQVNSLDYFELQKSYKQQKDHIAQIDQLYFEAVLLSAFNQPTAANQLISKYINSEQGKDSLSKNLLLLKLNNHIHLSQYAHALEVNKTLQRKYSSLLDSIEMDDLKNTHKIWKALKDTPSQKVIKNQDVSLDVTKDKAGLSTVETKLEKQIEHFVFDTGANFSVIQRSVAQELGMEIIDANFDVEAATGILVKSDIGIAKTMNLGAIKLSNVVFLVFDDQALSFPSIDYEIRGIVGFPVIRALEEVQFVKDRRIVIPETPSNMRLNNLALDQYMPIVKGVYNGDMISLNLDTGAQKTSLYARFYQRYQVDIESNYSPTTFTTGGAGGTVELEGYLINDFKLEIGKGVATLDSVQLSKGKIGNVDRLDGNLGQDFIKRFNTMTMNFKNSSIQFN